MGLLNNVLPFGLITWGQLTVPSGLAAIINAATAIFGVVVASLAFRDERLTPRRLAGVLLGFAGVATAIGLDRLGALDLTALPQLALVAAAVSYACAAAWARRMLGGLVPEVAAAGMVTSAALIALPVALIVDGLPALSPGVPALAAVGYLAVLATAGAYLLYYRVLGMAGAGNLSLVTLLVVPLAILLGALLFGESLPPRAFAGFALIAAGLLILDGRLLRR
jgi:drug/metabolite transporter (DMT)-like permease